MFEHSVTFPILGLMAVVSDALICRYSDKTSHWMAGPIYSAVMFYGLVVAEVYMWKTFYGVMAAVGIVITVVRYRAART